MWVGEMDEGWEEEAGRVDLYIYLPTYLPTYLGFGSQGLGNISH